eukprot:symbB.v1.2.007666.t1/scaffold475.1/size199048/7
MDHFRSNLKKERLLEDRYMEIDRQNRVLLKRMSEAMRKPNPYVVEKKEAAPPSLNRSGRKMEMIRITKDNARLLRSIQKPCSNPPRGPYFGRAMYPACRHLEGMRMECFRDIDWLYWEPWQFAWLVASPCPGSNGGHMGQQQRMSKALLKRTS